VKDDLYRYVIKAGTELSGHRIAETELPWRQYRTPYRIFLAEMLLVRTRADVVARLFEEIADRYPTIQALASADEDELKAVLRPLGLSKRVPLFIKAARYICEKHNGEIPNNVEDLLKVPGLGTYTATAIATFAYEQGLVPADVNILRFVSRLTGLEMKHITKGSEELRELLPFLSEQNVGLSAENLLDFTRLVCRARKPKCDECLLRHDCSYFRRKNAEE
jgi:A/G-specific adenine glycosylase